MKTNKVVLAGAAALLLTAPLSWRKVNDWLGTRVERVIDGDTFRTDNGQRIRLLGVNAPELGLCLGDEAKNELVKKIEGKRVILREPYVDHWGRVVALVYYKDRLINEDMLKTGWGRFESEKNSQKDKLTAASLSAKENEKGVFSQKCTQAENKDKPNCNIKGNVDGTKKTYHLAECNGYSITVIELDKGDGWFCSEKQAQAAGFEKSKNCQ